jgi:hypothetical protein
MITENWSNENARQLRDFLETPTGQFLLDTMRQSIGVPADGSDQGRTLVSAGEIRGRAQMLNWLLAHRQSVVQAAEKPSVAYPDLDDESHWEPAHT